MSATSGNRWAITRVRHIALNCTAFDECLDYYAGPWGLERLSDSDDQHGDAAGHRSGTPRAGTASLRSATASTT